MFSRRGLGEGWAGQCGVGGTGLPEAEFSLSSHLTQTAFVKGVVSQASPARAFQLRAVPQQRHLPVPQQGKQAQGPSPHPVSPVRSPKYSCFTHSSVWLLLSPPYSDQWGFPKPSLSVLACFTFPPSTLYSFIHSFKYFLSTYHVLGCLLGIQ